jgi:hypothetical protein
MDVLQKDILYFVHISKRMRIWVRKGCMKEEFKFWGLLQLYEEKAVPESVLSHTHMDRDERRFVMADAAFEQQDIIQFRLRLKLHDARMAPG